MDGPAYSNCQVRSEFQAHADGPVGVQFFRGTYYRWIQLATEISGLSTPQVIGIGDLHVENFGAHKRNKRAVQQVRWFLSDFGERRKSEEVVLCRLRRGPSAKSGLAEVGLADNERMEGARVRRGLF
jgi:uncharacterized protein (DUF2252 family)